MTSRSVRDGVFLVGGFHYFMAVVFFLATAAIFVFGLLPSLQGEVSQGMFVPFVGIIIGLVLCILYAVVGARLIRLKNSSRMSAVFLSGLGLMGGFIGVLGAVGTSVFGNPNPNWITITLIGAGTICFYAITAIMDIFILFFLFNKTVREVFYAEEWATNMVDQDALEIDA